MGYDQTFLLSSHDSGETLSELGKEEHETLIAFIYLFIYLYIYQHALKAGLAIFARFVRMVMFRSLRL